jgi:hypothetical protein
MERGLSLVPIFQRSANRTLPATRTYPPTESLVTITIATGRRLDSEVLEQVVAQLLAKAATADKRGLKKTAQSWRDTAINLQQQQQSRRQD